MIRYTPADESRQKIPWVEYTDGQGRTTAYTVAGREARSRSRTCRVREMDCMDCHNRPTHAFELPERAVDRAMSVGEISASLPYIKKKAVELLKATYPSNEAGGCRHPRGARDATTGRATPRFTARGAADIARSAARGCWPSTTATCSRP